jgi:lysylphosphatidylglycerol synthetase-like protein (DUF2156 family)
MVWTGWELDRIILLLVGLAELLLFGQVTMFHYRQNFHHTAMWLPIIGTPLIGIAAILLALINTPALVGLVKVLFWIGLVAGLIGFYYHFRGVGKRVDGYVTRNFLVGPPVILPLMISVLAVVGLFGLYWR